VSAEACATIAAASKTGSLGSDSLRL
jgi:hypothetical protein